jgi:hypothetical protein
LSSSVEADSPAPTISTRIGSVRSIDTRLRTRRHQRRTERLTSPKTRTPPDSISIKKTDKKPIAGFGQPMPSTILSVLYTPILHTTTAKISRMTIPTPTCCHKLRYTPENQKAAKQKICQM